MTSRAHSSQLMVSGITVVIALRSLGFFSMRNSIIGMTTATDMLSPKTSIFQSALVSLYHARRQYPHQNWYPWLNLEWRDYAADGNTSKSLNS